MGFLHKLRVAAWGESISSPAEKKLVRKLDFFILTYVCLSFFFNYLDRFAVSNAYVAGMKDALSLSGIDYNLMTVIYTVGYIVGQVPHALAIQVIAPRIWFPAMTALWAALTMCFAACNSLPQVLALRFLTGVVEASTYPGAQYIIGSWYKPEEIGKRVGLLTMSSQAGTMFAGVLMSAISGGMNNAGGVPGWKWSFIIAGIATFPVAIFGYVYFPDLPHNTKASYLSLEERALAISRLPPKIEKEYKLDFSLFKRVVFTSNFWIFTIFWGFGGLIEGFCSFTNMLLWMNAIGRFTSIQNTTYPLVISAVAIVSAFMCSVGLDLTGRRLPFGILCCTLQIIAGAIILSWTSIGDGAKFAAWYISGTSFMIQPIVFTWANTILARTGDDAARAVILYCMNGSSSVFFAWWGLVFYPATDAATGFHNGSIALIAVSVFILLWCFVVAWQDKRTMARYETEIARIDGVEKESTGGDVIEEPVAIVEKK